uniref:CSON011393 protein n=1 Tax=Culicoides sonorensis TaxID=179676 RepID=A0A336M8T3_CULSO
MEHIFIDKHKRREIKTIFATKGLGVFVEGAGLSKLSKKYNICVEKVDQMNLFQIRLTEVTDHTDLMLCTIDDEVFERIKVEQAINVSFNGFVDHLIKILDGCKKDELFVAILEDKGQKFMQLYEKRPFKNLTHLFLPLNIATTNEILFHINQALETFQNKLLSSRGQIERQTAELNDKAEIISDLRNEVKNLSQKLYEQENLIFNRNTEEVNRLQQTIKHLQEGKETMEKKMKHDLRSMQEKVESMSRECISTNEKLMHENKNNVFLKEEINRLNSYISELKATNHKLMQDNDKHKSRENRLEQKVSELQKLYNDAQESLLNHQKDIQRISAELEAEKNIAHSKRTALSLASEEITSANRIIIKQKKEMEKLKNKIDVRTEVALQQEKVIEEKEKDNEVLQGIVRELKREFDATKIKKNEFIDTIDSLQDSVCAIEEKYSKKIKELSVDLDRAVVTKAKYRLIN